jgi:hypothetical protein
VLARIHEGLYKSMPVARGLDALVQRVIALDEHG